MPKPVDPIAKVPGVPPKPESSLDPPDAIAWIAAIDDAASGTLAMDVDLGVYGHRLTTVDVAPDGFERYRRLAALVGLDDRPPHVITALAVDGKHVPARSRRFAVGGDFIERVHIRAATRQAACGILGDLLRDKALTTMKGPGYRLHEVTFGSWPADAVVGREAVQAGAPVSWTPADVARGQIAYRAADGAATLTWTDATVDPGWCTLTWTVDDRERIGIERVSTVLAATWEAPDGTIAPIDGLLAPYSQEVRLEV